MEEANERETAAQAVLPIGWHCVQRRGARPPSAFIVFPRLASSRLGVSRRYSLLLWLALAPRRLNITPYTTILHHILELCTHTHVYML